MVPPSARPQDPGGCKCMCTTNAHVPYAPARRHQSRHRAASPAPTTARSPGRRRRTASPRHGDRQTGEDSRDLRAADKRTPRCADVGFVRCPSGGKDHHAPHVSVRAVSSRFAGSRVRLPFHFRSIAAPCQIEVRLLFAYRAPSPPDIAQSKRYADCIVPRTPLHARTFSTLY